MSLVTPVDPVPVEQLGRVHLVGIGGAGMSGIARVLLRAGVPVSGSDSGDSAVLEALREAGAQVYIGHDAGHVGQADTVVTSTAIRATNPELGYAREHGLRVLPRAAALASLMLNRYGIAVAGTHGKTTTTSMLTTVAQQAGAHPGYVIGGQLSATGVGADDGGGSVFIAEADESDGSFLMLSPRGAVVTNIEADHLDNYTGLDQIRENFERFVQRIVPGGFLVACADDPGAAALAAQARRGAGLTVVTYGESAGADVALTDVHHTATGDGGIAIAFTVPGAGEFVVPLPGRHNALNATAVLATARRLGWDDDTVRAALASFGGAARRFERKGEVGGVAVFDSYAHHPTELAADLDAARELATGRDGRVVAVFQPHLFSRTRAFAAEFGAALGRADEVVVLDVYPAREDPVPGVTGALVADAVPGERAVYQPDFAAAPETVAALARPGDTVLTMGAGDVTQIGPLILAALGGRTASAPAAGSS